MRIFNKFKGTRGFLSTGHNALRWAYMITEIAKHRFRVLAHWEKHGIQSTVDAFNVKERTLFNWKKVLREGRGRIEALNPGKREPKQKRKRIWPLEILNEIKRIRWQYPNLGSDKIYPLLLEFCTEKKLPCPKPITIKRLIKDLGGLRMIPQKVSHFGRIKSFKRRKVLRKPRDLKAEYPGHVVALDTVERFVHGIRRYVITFEDIYSRYGFAWCTKSHASLAASEFFELCRNVFPFPFTFVLTDNGSEFAKHFSAKIAELHMIHYHPYPRTPKMNAHCESFNGTIQDEFVDYHSNLLFEDTAAFNEKMKEYLLFYNTKRVHWAFKNKQTPLEVLATSDYYGSKLTAERKNGWGYAKACNF